MPSLRSIYKVSNSNTIDHVSLTSTVGLTKTYTLWADLAETLSLGTFTVTDGVDGVDGRNLDHISLTSTNGLTRTYTSWADLAETISLGTFTITDGADGVNGVNGVDGVDGVDGADGQNVDHISLTSTVGLAKTYTSWADLAETIPLGTFTVTDGAEGVEGADGTSVVAQIVTEAEYADILIPDPNTLYVIPA
jgi:hypothetical protein